MIDRSTEQNKNTVDFPSAWLDTVDESRPDISALLKTASGTELGLEYIPYSASLQSHVADWRLDEQIFNGENFSPELGFPFGISRNFDSSLFFNLARPTFVHSHVQNFPDSSLISSLSTLNLTY
jgi:hypothetical protein